MFKILHIPTASFVRSRHWYDDSSYGEILRWNSRDGASSAIKYWNFGFSKDGVTVRELYYDNKNIKLPAHEFMVVEEDV